MTNAEARFNKSLRPRKPEGSLGRTAQDGHLDSHTAPELWPLKVQNSKPISLSVFFSHWNVKGFSSKYIALKVDVIQIEPENILFVGMSVHLV